MEETRDLGQQPESEKMYDSDIAVDLDEQAGKKGEKRSRFEDNVLLMKKWARQGK